MLLALEDLSCPDKEIAPENLARITVIAFFGFQLFLAFIALALCRDCSTTTMTKYNNLQPPAAASNSQAAV